MSQLWALCGFRQECAEGVFFLDNGIRFCRFTVQVNLRFLPKDKHDDWLTALVGKWSVFFPAVVEEQVHWRRLSAEDLKVTTDGPEWGLERTRASEPVKSFFFSPRERVASFPEKMEVSDAEPRILFGAKACDVAALEVHRRMFLAGEFKDEFYERRRRNTLIVTADCPTPAETCFCNLVGNHPYAPDDRKSGSDVVLSVVDGGWLLEAVTEAGEQLLLSAATVDATETQKAARVEARRAADARLKKINPKGWEPDPPPGKVAGRIVARELDEEFWARHAADCVECYACLMACPTCYCFLLYDKAKEQGMERTKVWDACYVAAYARVGGGANPRAEFIRRFYNRFFCKFSHFKTWQGMYACTGCGRCIAACMGKIDVRKVLLEV